MYTRPIPFPARFSPADIQVAGQSRQRRSSLELCVRERAELRRQGAKASARGEPIRTNPMLSEVNKPAATGEPVSIWFLRCVAWHTGFLQQEGNRCFARSLGLDE